MRLGFVSAILPDLSLEEVLGFAQAEGFACVEAMCWPPGRAERKFAGVTHIDVTRLDRGRAENIRELCAKYNVGISALGYYPNPLDPNPAVSKKAVEHLKKVIVGAEKLGLGNVNTFIGRDWTKTADENWPRFLRTWKPLIAFAEAHAIKIGIENCPMYYSQDEWPGGKNLATTPEIWRRMFNDIPSDYFGLNYDPSHFILQFMDPIAPLREFKSKLFHAHAKDVQIRPDWLDRVGIFAVPKKWHTPRIPGFGDLNWSRYMAALYEVGYGGPVCVEVEDDTFGPTLEERKASLRISHGVLAPYF
jgi:sugar phosphate isomerase/epimerase